MKGWFRPPSAGRSVDLESGGGGISSGGGDSVHRTHVADEASLGRVAWADEAEATERRSHVAPGVYVVHVDLLLVVNVYLAVCFQT